MKNKLAGILIAAFYLISMFAGFAGTNALTINAVTVQPFNANTPAPDSITVTGTESHTWTGDGSGTHVFYLPAGTYSVTVAKAGYTSFVYNNLVLTASTAANTNIYYQMTATSGGTNNGGTNNGGTTPTPDGTPNTSLAISDVNYDDEVHPGDTTTVEVKLKNNLGYDAEDVTITVTLKGIDSGDDLEETTDVGTLDKKQSDTFDVNFDIPTDAKAGKYSMDVKVEWQDQDSNDYYNTKPTITSAVEVIREKHDVQITGMQFLTSSVAAGGSSQVSVSLLNVGRSDEDVKIKVEIPELGVSLTSAQFKLNSNDDTTQYVQFKVPSDTKSGQYFVYATVYFDGGSANNQEIGTVAVAAPTTQTKQQPVTITPIVVQTQTSDKETVEMGISEKTAVGIGVGIVILIIVVAVLYREYSPRLNPKPIVIKATTRGGR